MLKEYFLRLYTYNHWANETYLAFFKKQKDRIPERIHLLFSHVVSAQTLWLKRIKDEKDLDAIHIWKIIPWEELEDMANKATKNWLDYLKNADQKEFDRILSYVNFQKKPYQTIISDIIIHTANHATYHRAQFAVLLRQENIDPPNTDFITFSRVLSNQL